MANTNLRVGKVSSVDYETGMLKVVYTDKGSAVTANLPYANLNNEYRMPQIGEYVLSAHLSNGTSKGVVLGSYWNKSNLPNESGETLYRKDYSKTAGVAMTRYDDSSGEYLLKAPNIEVNAINELILDGPKIQLEANISIEIATLEATIDIPEITLKGGEDDLIKTTSEADIELESEKYLKAQIKQLIIETIEEGISLTSKKEVEISAEEDVTVSTEKAVQISAETEVQISAKTEATLKSDADIILEDSGHKTTLSSMLERLEALDGNTSARK